ncbi:hypothetical protein R5W23_003778 [Gemmata sp. JC673]|uniref:Uncharacterized protein n=1 Tax=Gemmata algarum TaxID=2975278 RepID=A0ABU5F5B6_9BACT|nr:hypothetical protein [Gemmata algarum]MDY3562313.1 hypothetical protein [Gemmata algarum]
MTPTTVDERLGHALGIDYAGHPNRPRRTSERQLRYVWRVTCTDGWFGSASLMVAGFLLRTDPHPRQAVVPVWKAALGSRFDRHPPSPIVTADLTDDPVVGPLAAVRWCHLSPFNYPPYWSQADGSRMSISFWTAENAGMSVSVELPSTAFYYRRSIARVHRAAIELADRVARTSDDVEFRKVVAECFPGAGTEPTSMTPSPEELSQYLARLLQWWGTARSLTASDFEDRARDLWQFGIDERHLPELLPDYPPALAERVLPILRRMREDSEA